MTRLVAVVVCLATGGETLDLRGAEFQHVPLKYDGKLSRGSQSDTASKGSFHNELLAMLEEASVVSWRRPDEQQPTAKKGKAFFPACLFVACLGSLLAYLGLDMVIKAYKARIETRFMLGDSAHRANATITGTRHVITTSTDWDDGESLLQHETTYHHYVAEYTFEAIRRDGMSCRVVVPERDQPHAFWKTLEVNKLELVLYNEENPARCRLHKAAEADNSNWEVVVLYLKASCGAVLVCAGFLLGVVLSSNCGFKAAGTMGGIICACTCFCCVGCGVLSDTVNEQERKKGASDVKVKEIGFVKKAEHLENIAGLWQLESDLGVFEYNFTDGSLHLSVKGRLKGSDAWDAACRAHFAGAEGTELVWTDSDNSHFRLLFDGPDKFTGSIQTDAGEMVEFRGSRPST